MGFDILGEFWGAEMSVWNKYPSDPKGWLIVFCQSS